MLVLFVGSVHLWLAAKKQSASASWLDPKVDAFGTILHLSLTDDDEQRAFSNPTVDEQILHKLVDQPMFLGLLRPIIVILGLGVVLKLLCETPLVFFWFLFFLMARLPWDCFGCCLTPLPWVCFWAALRWC